MYIPGKSTESVPQNTSTGIKEVPAENDMQGTGEQSTSTSEFISPDLQKLVDSEAKRLENGEMAHNATSELSRKKATEEDWQWLRTERDRRLEATDTINKMVNILPFEKRGELYKYRQELRDLPIKLGNYWNREDVVWPKQPV